MSFDDAELLREFVVESQEHLADVENQLLTLEAQGDQMDVGLVNKVFRAVHSIKGAAGFFGLETLQGLAHREEEVLNKLRSFELRPTSVVINTLLRATDKLKTLLDVIDTSNEQDVSEHVSALERILSGEAYAPAAVIESAARQPAAPNGAVAASSATALSADSQSSGISGEALREFLIESFDNVEQLERDLITLERQPASTTLINGVFRCIHTIKGTAGFLGFTKLEQLTHVAENLLGSVRAGQMDLDAAIITGLFGVTDTVRELLAAIEATGSEGNADPTEQIAALNALYQSKLNLDHRTVSACSDESPKAAKSSKRSKPSKAVAKAPTKVAKSTKSDAVEESTGTHTDQKPNQCQNDVPPSIPEFQVSHAVAQTAEVAACEPISSIFAALMPSAQETVPVDGAMVRSGNASGEGSGLAAESTIRVDVALLDKLMTCVGELVLARNQILQFSNGQNDSELHSTSQRLNLITTELQEGVMKTRMQPIGNVWSKFPRLVRDLAAICGKQVRIEMEGKETELDKTIIEAIKDPLTHLVRNTVDHGIEKPEVRLKKGKPVEGCLTLRAYHEGGQVNIEICDDGAGLNVERIRQKAIERGLLPADQAARLPDREAGNLIFLPGFSTAETVSNVSGRGVGMDVVKTNIEKIGGTVDLQSRPGHGTTIKIKIPLTLAIIPALIVASDGNRYAIPQVNLLELLRLDGDQVASSVEWIQGAPVYRLRGRLLPLVYLREQLRCAQPEQAFDALNIVVLRADDRQFGLVVDRINDTEEIVVKPLSKQLKGIPLYSGTTIMGDGKVALILDVLGLAHSANVISETRDRQKSDSSDRSSNRLAHAQSLLIVGVGSDHRFAMPLSLVTRLEKIDAASVETADHQLVVQYRGEILPLMRLADAMHVSPSPATDSNSPIDVVVYAESGHSVGIIVDRIIDIVDTQLEVTRQTRRPGLLGSAVVQGHVTDLLDLPAIIRQINPQQFEGN